MAIDDELKSLISFFEALKTDTRVEQLFYEPKSGHLFALGCNPTLDEFWCCAKSLYIDGVIEELRTLL